MTRKEQLTLDVIGEDLREMKTDVKSLLSFQASFTEKCLNYDGRLDKFDKDAEERDKQLDWLNKKMYLFAGAIAVIVFLIDKFIHGAL